MSEHSLAEGSVFDERYVIKSVAGRGGMATVYRAFHSGLGRDVALKILHEDRGVTADEYKRLKQEAQLVSSLHHPNITAVNAVGICDERPYVAFEFLEGVSLARYVTEHEGTLPFRHFLRIMEQVCDGLQCAHGNNIVHRDLKPENIFLVGPDSPGEVVKIVDFGIAKALQQAVGKPAAQKLTATGSVMGTPTYMSPEQCAGIGVDARSDIYAIGCIMYFCLMKKPPFDGDSLYEVMYAHGNATPPQVVLPAGYSEGVMAMIAKCMSKSPADRYQSVSELRADLDALERGAEVSISLPTISRSEKSKSTKSKVMGLLPVAAVVLALGGMFAQSHWQEIRLQVTLASLQGQWDSNKYSDTAAAVGDALRRDDRVFAEALAVTASHAAYKRPTLEAARGIFEIAKAFRSADKRGVEFRRWTSKTNRILRFMPTSDWKRSGAMELLEEVVSNDETDTAPGMTAALVHWIRWQTKVRDFALQNMVLDHCDTICGDAKFPWSAFRDLMGHWGQSGILTEQWQNGQVKSASHISQIVYDHSANNAKDERETPVYSSVIGRAANIKSALLADVPHFQHNMSFLEDLQADPRLQSAFTKVPVLLQYAEELWSDENPNGALDHLHKAETYCDKQSVGSAALGLTYYGVIGDGYLSLGKSEDATRAYRKVLNARAAYEKSVDGYKVEPDYCNGRLLYSVAHAYHMLGDDTSAMAAAVDAEGRLGQSGKLRNGLRSCFDLWMAVVDGDVYAYPGTSGELRKRIANELARAGFHAVGGRFSDSAREVRHVSLMLHGGRPGMIRDFHYGLPFKAGWLAATLADFAPIAEECLKESVAHSDGLIKLDSQVTLAELYARTNRYPEALKLLRDAAAGAKSDQQRWRVSKHRLPITYSAHDWNGYCTAYQEMEELNAREPDLQPVQGEYVETWQEVYVYALRQLGKQAEANAQADAIDRRLGS